jgi:hypothetical protein
MQSMAQPMPSPSMYPPPPMYNPMGQYGYPRPMGNGSEAPPPASSADGNSQANRYMEDAIRMQQMYMYYYSLYQGGGFNPMMAPQMGAMGNFMNSPYASFGAPQGKGLSGNSAPGMPFGGPPIGLNPQEGVGQMNPSMGMNHSNHNNFGSHGNHPNSPYPTSNNTTNQQNKVRDDLAGIAISNLPPKSQAK